MVIFSSPVPGGGPRHLSDSFLSLETNYPGGVDKQGPSGLVSLRPGWEEAPLGRRVQGPEVQRKPGQAPGPRWIPTSLYQCVQGSLFALVTAQLMPAVPGPRLHQTNGPTGLQQHMQPWRPPHPCAGSKHQPRAASVVLWAGLCLPRDLHSCPSSLLQPSCKCGVLEISASVLLHGSRDAQSLFPITARKPQVGWGSEGQRICLCVPLKEGNLGPRYPVPTQLQRAIGGQGSS